MHDTPDISGPSHPLYAAECDHEARMTAVGAERFARHADKALSTGNATRLSPVRHLLNAWLAPLAERIARYSQPTGNVGKPDRLRRLLAGVDALDAARITLALMLNGIHGRDRKGAERS